MVTRTKSEGPIRGRRGPKDFSAQHWSQFVLGTLAPGKRFCKLKKQPESDPDVDFAPILCNLWREFCHIKLMAASGQAELGLTSCWEMLFNTGRIGGGLVAANKYVRTIAKA
jgi:hypothetical protein